MKDDHSGGLKYDLAENFDFLMIHCFHPCKGMDEPMMMVTHLLSQCNL